METLPELIEVEEGGEGASERWRTAFRREPVID